MNYCTVILQTIIDREHIYRPTLRMLCRHYPVNKQMKLSFVFTWILVSVPCLGYASRPHNTPGYNCVIFNLIEMCGYVMH